MLSSAAISVMLSYLQPIIIRVFWPDSFVVDIHVSEPCLTYVLNLALKNLDHFASENGHGQ
jgi:hypothetical protein